MIKFACPHCQAALSAADHQESTTDVCPACGKAVEVPAVQRGFPELPPVAQPLYQESQQQARASRPPRPVNPRSKAAFERHPTLRMIQRIFWIIGLLLLVFGALLGAIWAASAVVTVQGLPGIVVAIGALIAGLVGGIFGCAPGCVYLLLAEMIDVMLSIERDVSRIAE